MDDKRITDEKHILEHITKFYETILRTETKTTIEMENFFSNVDIPRLSKNQTKLCEADLNQKDL